MIRLIILVLVTFIAYSVAVTADRVSDIQTFCTDEGHA